MTIKCLRIVLIRSVWIAMASFTSLAILPPTRAAKGAPSGNQVRVLVVTGGHDFNKAGFFAMFRKMKGIVFTHAAYGQGATERLNPKGARDYDVIVFYDMYEKKDPQWRGILRLLSKGKGMVFLHHSLWFYDGTWPQYQHILGGRASSKEKVVPGLSPTSTYKDAQHLHVHVVDPSSPVTRGLQDFDILDEAYNHYRVDPDVHVLLTTDNPASEKVIAWSHHYKKSRIVYVELGHGPSAYENRNYSTFVRQAIFWVERNPF